MPDCNHQIILEHYEIKYFSIHVDRKLVWASHYRAEISRDEFFFCGILRQGMIDLMASLISSEYYCRLFYSKWVSGYRMCPILGPVANSKLVGFRENNFLKCDRSLKNFFLNMYLTLFANCLIN